MTRYVALIRGINVGGNQRLAMADLRRVLSRLGYAQVRTVLQSGNAVFDAHGAEPAALAAAIERAIADDLGMSVRCVVRSADAFRAVIERNPLREIATNGATLLALFLADEPDPRLQAEHDPAALAPGQVVVGEGVLYQWCPDGIAEAPPVGTLVEKHWRVAVTGRNWNTVMRLAALLDS